MSTMTIHEEYGFRVSKNDMLLILKALGGRLKSDEMIAEAKELGDRLTMDRITQIENMANQLRKALEN